MLMTPLRMVALRLWCVTLGRSAWAMSVLRKGLLRLLISSRKKEDRYVASARFFTPDELSD
jgi:hypothetical protein